MTDLGAAAEVLLGMGFAAGPGQQHNTHSASEAVRTALFPVVRRDLGIFLYLLLPPSLSIPTDCPPPSYSPLTPPPLLTSLPDH